MSCRPTAARPARPGLRHDGGGPGRRACPDRAVCLALAAAAAADARSAGSQHPARPARLAHFGGYPSFLPRGTLNYHSDAVLTGTVRRPALTNQGDGVEVKTAHWSVLVTVTGPQVPGEGLPYQAPVTTCTWVVTMSRATGASADLSRRLHQHRRPRYHVYRPAFVPGQPKPPGVLRPGTKVSFELRAVEAAGEGLMRWAPDGRNIVAKWDFIVEND